MEVEVEGWEEVRIDGERGDEDDGRERPIVAQALATTTALGLEKVSNLAIGGARQKASVMSDIFTVVLG